MNKTSVTVLAAAALAAIGIPASAEPLTGLFAWQVSADGGATWSSSITINPGDPYRIRAVASWTDGPTASLGFASSTFEQIDLIGADATDVFGGASGPGGVPTYLLKLQVNPEVWTLQPGSGASSAGLKIDNASPASPSRLNLSQFPKGPLGGPGGVNPDFIDDNPILVLDMNAAAGDAKALTISATWTSLGTPATHEFKVYTSATGTAKKPTQEAVMTDAHIWIRSNASCTADFNGDGLVDFSDYLEFLTFYDTQDFRADLNHDGLVDFSDYLDFLTAYDAGC